MTKAQTFAVTENVWCVRRASYLTCSYIVTTPRGTVLIDAGMDSSGRDILGGLMAINREPSTIQSIMLTHWHNDHAAGSRAIQELTETSVHCHAKERPQLMRLVAHRGLRGQVSDLIPEWGLLVLFKGLLGAATPRAVESPVSVESGDVLEEFFEVIETPGHTPGHLSYYYRPEKVLFAGDALAVVNDRIRFMARPVTPDLDRARTSMKKCLSFDVNVLCPGHRVPLVKEVPRRCDEMLDYLDSAGRWPLLG